MHSAHLPASSPSNKHSSRTLLHPLHPFQCAFVMEGQVSRVALLHCSVLALFNLHVAQSFAISVRSGLMASTRADISHLKVLNLAVLGRAHAGPTDEVGGQNMSAAAKIP
eukprot:396409-Amphidinium_carterae.1